MADTTFVSRVTNIVTAWVQAVNNWIYRGADPNFAVLTGGPTADVLTLPSDSAITALTPGMKLRFQVNIPNTGPVTLTLQPAGLTNDLRLPGGVPLTYDELAANMGTEVIWNGTYWELMSSAYVPVNNQTALVRKTSAPLVDLKISVSQLTSVDRTWTAIDEDLTVVGLTNSQTLTNKKITSLKETVQTNASIMGAVSCDCALGNIFSFVLTGNTTLSFANVPGSGDGFVATFLLVQGGVGSYTVTWPGSVLWPAATAPTLTTTVGKSDVITLMTLDGGASWRGFVAGQNY